MKILDWHVPLSEPVQPMPEADKKDSDAPVEDFVILRNPMSFIAKYKDGVVATSDNPSRDSWIDLKRTGIISIEFVMNNTGKRETLRGKWYGRREWAGTTEFISTAEDLPFGELERLWPGCIWHKGSF